MRKDILIEGIRGMILKSEAVDDNTKVLHYKRVEAAVGSAFAELIQTLAKKDTFEIENNYVKSYYDQPVISSDSQQYTVLLDNIVSLPNGKGVWFVKPSGSTVGYQPTSSHHTSLFGSLPMGKLVNDTWYKVGNPKSATTSIIFNHIGDSFRRSVKSVDYGVVRAFDSYDDEEDVHLPSEAYSFVTEKVLSWFGVRRNDLVNQGQ